MNLVGRVTRAPRRRSWHGQALKEMLLDSSPASVHAWQENIYFRDQFDSLRNHTSTDIPEISFNLRMKSAISRARDARMCLLWTLLSTCPRYVWSISLSFRVSDDNRQASTSPPSDLSKRPLHFSYWMQLRRGMVISFALASALHRGWLRQRPRHSGATVGGTPLTSYTRRRAQVCRRNRPHL